MNTSNLAKRLEEFATSAPEARTAARMLLVAANDTVRRAPRRLTLTLRRMLNRDGGLRQFRVY